MLQKEEKKKRKNELIYKNIFYFLIKIIFINYNDNFNLFNIYYNIYFFLFRNNLISHSLF